MFKNVFIIFACFLSVAVYSCSKKTTPVSSSEAVAITPAKTDSFVVKKVAAMPKLKPVAAVPKVIVVNDAGAKKAVDGRLYYDLQGRRYWRNNKDGKYYLYNKSMHNNDAFKAPAKNP